MSVIKATVSFEIVLDKDHKGIPRVVEDIGWAGVINAGLHELTKQQVGIVEIRPGKRRLAYVDPKKKPTRGHRCRHCGSTMAGLVPPREGERGWRCLIETTCLRRQRAAEKRGTAT